MTLNTQPYAYALRSTDADSSSPGGDINSVLTDLERTRSRQLASLSDTSTDLVAIAYRASVARILEEIRLARRRLADGLHGVCIRCSRSIPAERVEALPWATDCADCARRRSY